MNDEDKPTLSSADVLEDLLRSAMNKAANERHYARGLAEIVELMARAGQRVEAMKAISSKGGNALVKFDHGQAHCEVDQATFRFNIGAAKTSLSQLISHALNGDNVVLCRANHPVARIVPYERAVPPPVAAPAYSPEEEEIGRYLAACEMEDAEAGAPPPCP